MKRLRKKLHSERGASILLALLMLLVCMMVGASVLAAAASNAGKARSNRTEQQRYLNLTSAIQLVADEIAKATYKGTYTVWEWDEVETVKETDSSVTPPLETTVSVTRRSYFYCMQTEGEYSCGDLDEQLPFQPRLEELFGSRFTAKGTGFEPLPVPTTPPPAGQYDLLVTPEGLPDDAPEGYKVPKEVTVRVKLDGNTHHILLTAWEGDSVPLLDPADPARPDLSKAVQAELVAKEGTIPVLDYNPGSREAGTLKDDGPGGKTFPDPKPPEASGNRTTTYEIENAEKKPYPDSTGKPLQWELSWIRKGAVSS